MNTQTYTDRLEALLLVITGELKAIGIHNPENTNDWLAVPDDLDAEEPDQNLLADAIEGWNERNALVATLEPRYNSIVAALERIKNGTFGICEICKKEIEEKRLEANPAARTCTEHIEEESSL